MSERIRRIISERLRENRERQNNMNEAPIDYSDYSERMDPGIERDLEQGTTPYGQRHPSFPETNGEQNFAEILASKRFKDVIDSVKQYTGAQTVPRGLNGIMQFQSILMTGVHRIFQLEAGHREELEQLAVDLVKQEFALEESDLEFDVRILDLTNQEQAEEMQQSIQQMNQQAQEMMEMPEEEQEMAAEEVINTFENFEAEKQKRRFINALIQGSAQKANTMYHLVGERLNDISPELLNLYGLMMAVNDLQYWLLPDAMIEDLAAQGSGAGSVRVEAGDEAGDENNNGGEDKKTKIIARGINFPTLVHELTKGVVETITATGLPQDPELAMAVMSEEDTLPKEKWDLRLGPVIWEKFRAAYPERLFDDDKRRIQSYFIAEIAQLPATEFLELTNQIMSGSDEGKRRLENIVTGLIESLNRESYEDTMSQYDDDDYDEDETIYQEPETPTIVEPEKPKLNIDMILDKISVQGMDSLTPEERNFLYGNV